MRIGLKDHRLSCIPLAILLMANSPEVPLGIDISNDTVAIRVHSNGCTNKNDFQVEKSEVPGGVVLSFVRTRPDPCRAFIRDGVMLRWTRAELGIGADAAIFLDNTHP